MLEGKVQRVKRSNRGSLKSSSHKTFFKLSFQPFTKYKLETFWKCTKRNKSNVYFNWKVKVKCILLAFEIHCAIYVIIFVGIMPYGTIIRKDEQWEGTASCVTFTASQITFTINISYNFLYYRVIYLYITCLLLILKKMFRQRLNSVLLTSLAETNHAISVLDASCPLTRHLISLLVQRL